MKMHFNKFIILTFCILGQSAYSQNNVDEFIIWKFRTSEKIVSTPIQFKGRILVGGMDGYLYSLDPDTGKEYWKFDTGFPISGNPLVVNKNVIVESGNRLYSINDDGSKNWVFDQSDTSGSAPTDAWDLHHSSPVYHQGKIYYGSGDGYVFGVSDRSGKEAFRFASDELQQVRSTPAISEGKIYFGDWNGKIYGVDLRSKKLLWKVKTFEEKPYPNFGAIIYNFSINNGLVFYGARNPHIMALDAETGHEIWSFTDPGGSWIPGNSIIENGMLFLGGSDNHKMLAINAASGKVQWEFDAKQNIYSKPIILNDRIIFTSFYSGYGDPKSEFEGSVFILEISTGKLIQQIQFEDKILSSPVEWKGMLYVGCNDGNLYCLDMNRLLK